MAPKTLATQVEDLRQELKDLRQEVRVDQQQRAAEKTISIKGVEVEEFNKDDPQGSKRSAISNIVKVIRGLELGETLNVIKFIEGVPSVVSSGERTTREHKQELEELKEGLIRAFEETDLRWVRRVEKRGEWLDVKLKPYATQLLSRVDSNKNPCDKFTFEGVIFQIKRVKTDKEKPEGKERKRRGRKKIPKDNTTYSKTKTNNNSSKADSDNKADNVDMSSAVNNTNSNSGNSIISSNGRQLEQTAVNTTNSKPGNSIDSGGATLAPVISSNGRQLEQTVLGTKKGLSIHHSAESYASVESGKGGFRERSRTPLKGLTRKGGG